MTGHFTTLDGCERWAQLVGQPTEYYRVPFSYRTPCEELRPPRNAYAYRTYRLESVEFGKGLAHYVEVYQ